MIDMSIGKDTKFQKYINDCQFPSPPPGQMVAQAKTQYNSGDNVLIWKQAVRKEILHYIKENMPLYTAAICKKNGGLMGNGQRAVWEFLENNLSFADASLLSKYDFAKYQDKKKKRLDSDKTRRPKGLVGTLDSIFEEEVSIMQRPKSANIDNTFTAGTRFEDLQSLLEELKLEEAVNYTIIPPSEPTKRLIISNNKQGSVSTQARIEMEMETKSDNKKTQYGL